MNILEFINQFDLQGATIENLGHEFFKEQIVLTINLCNLQDCAYHENEHEPVIENFVFSGVTEIKINPCNFKLDSNEILEVKHEQLNENSWNINIIFKESNSFDIVALSFKADAVEWDRLNLYL